MYTIVNSLLIGLCFITIACSEQSEDYTEITFWAMGAEGEKIEPLIEKFEQSYPTTKIKVQHCVT